MEQGVLLAGADASFLHPLADRLRRMALRVLTCSSGKEALELSGARSFDVALVERELADMDALELCRGLRANGSAAILFVCSDVDLAIEAVVAHEAGADDFLLKSLDPLVIEAKVRRGLRRIAQHIWGPSDRAASAGAFGLPNGEMHACSRASRNACCAR